MEAIQPLGHPYSLPDRLSPLLSLTHVVRAYGSDSLIGRSIMLDSEKLTPIFVYAYNDRLNLEDVYLVITASWYCAPCV